MTSSISTFLSMNWQEQARQLLTEGKYSELASFYEQAIANEPDTISHYWHLGLAYLLQGEEEEAQVTWMSVMVDGAPEEVEEWTRELIQILDTEAYRQTDLNNLQVSWIIRYHIREIEPSFLNNILNLIQLSIALGNFTPEHLSEWQVVTILQQSSLEDVDSALLSQVIKKILYFPTPETLAFVEACLLYQNKNSEVFIQNLLLIAIDIAHKSHQPKFAVSLTQLCLKLKPEHPDLLWHLACFYSEAELHQQAIETAQRYFHSCQNIPDRVLGSYLLLRTFLSAGAWLEVEPVADQYKSLVRELVQNPPESIKVTSATHLLIANFFLPYLQDLPQENRWLQNQVAKLFQKELQAANLDSVKLPRRNHREPTRPLKIGYVAHHLQGHSVGWLSRWLFQYHNRESFQTNLYLICQNLENQSWFRDKVDFIHSLDCDSQAIATKIKEDQIDILVDLDSLTVDLTCEVMALKPAPIQVTWLGWDATGIPAIDYYIADPYVLPENAQEYYSETIWRLPHTYVAVDGFEVDVPTLRREQLEIPSDAVIYLSAQRGYKRHPDTVRLQMQILKQVPNSYFLIKGMADETAIQQFFTQVAESEGVEPSRLKFLPKDANEYVHRANLSIADVVLDTYPYNGATTTLETLWMCVPLVTRVGQQFSARNSYGFMMNVGVTEGIAWTDEEYIEWGVKLGQDSMLRQQISWQLRQSRQTSPLWNAKQFTQEMEKAYKQMWAIYCQ
ncbi:O-linked N-acetylglucosamine transferase, SPINDLY family protein [Cyanosarcina cf. burmensis CCALA 770]|nr:O-linked N-acetylglucosamine transferase, SPINDLY family protein [Cyanosarcina cf. burmensis CCALA 770]